MPSYVLDVMSKFSKLMHETYVRISRHQTLDSVNFSNGGDSGDIVRLKHV